MAQTVGLNERHGRTSLRLFEIGKAFRASNSAKSAIAGIVEMDEIAVLMTGRAEPVAWDVPARVYDVFDLRGLIERYLARIGGKGIEFREVVEAQWGFDSTALEVRINGDEVGRVGRIDEWLLARHDISGAPVIAVFDVDRLIPHLTRSKRFSAPTRYPVVHRDLSIIVDDAKRHAELESTIRAAGGPLLSGVELFDLFRGDRLGAGRVSLAFAVSFTSYEGTLDDATVESAMRSITEKLASEHGARQLRSA